jgi:hypothetical protein
VRSVFIFDSYLSLERFNYNIYLQGHDGMLLESIEMGYAE